MKSILIIGAGQYGQMLKEIAIDNGFEKIDFLDDNNDIAIGKINDLDRIQKAYTGCICAIGNNNIRADILSRINNKISLISKNAIVFSSSKIGNGCVIEPGAIISANTIIEDGCLICAGSVINHNSIIKKCCQIDCNSVVKGIVPEKTKVKACSLWEQGE